MSDNDLYPRYIARQEGRVIEEQVAIVRADGRSRAVLLYGAGGVGKTSLVRGLAREAGSDDGVVWLDPVDMDDPEYWLLSNLERKFVEELDPQHHYFGPYLDYLSHLPLSARPRLGRDTVVSHLGRIKRVFVDCYAEFVRQHRVTIVMTFDTVETIRGVYPLYTLTQWMKALPATLFILSGRPQLRDRDRGDRIRSELTDPHQPIDIKTVELGEFSWEEADAYLSGSNVAGDLRPDEHKKLLLLTQGHPLWLAFAISYVDERGIPEEAEDQLSTIEQQVPYHQNMTSEGRQRHEAFKRRLVTPYQEVDFWHEAIKRLAVVRQSVSQEAWRQLMDDRGLPDTAPDLNQAWQQLLETPWIRTRANGRYVTLHDAVAEELAQRIIPLHDRDQQWRRYLWARAADIYGRLTKESEPGLTNSLNALDGRLQRLEEQLRLGAEADRSLAGMTLEEQGEERDSIQEVARLDAQKRELDQFRAVSLYYRMLCDFVGGTGQFLTLFEEAKRQQDVFFLDRLALEMQRFLPGTVPSYALDDVIRIVLEEFGDWLRSDGKSQYLAIGLNIADYLIDNERSELAIGLLNGLPDTVAAVAGDRQRCRLSILKGNAYMRIPDQVATGLTYFNQALSDAKQSSDPHRLAADALKETGFYYRNSGLWLEADKSYQAARDEISSDLYLHDLDADHEDMASIQTNWAYLKGLRGDYREGSSLVESAINVRRRLGLRQQEGISWSVCGEVHRYDRQFQKAWDAFLIAEGIFQGQRNWSWLGNIYQQQAICLFQARQYRIPIVLDPEPRPDSRSADQARMDTMEQARRRIIWSLDICRYQNLRAYPSALNRAGRILGETAFETGLHYLREGIDWAQRLSDGWFWFANLVEYAELSYRAYATTGERSYREDIDRQAGAVWTAAARYSFPDLEGRWILLQGHLAIHDAVTAGDPSGLGAALENYTKGFQLMAQGYVGSSGAPALPREFDKFKVLYSRLPSDVRSRWRREFRRSWSGPGHGATQLLARLEELY